MQLRTDVIAIDGVVVISESSLHTPSVQPKRTDLYKSMGGRPWKRKERKVSCCCRRFPWASSRCCCVWQTAGLGMTNTISNRNWRHLHLIVHLKSSSSTDLCDGKIIIPALYQMARWRDGHNFRDIIYTCPSHHTPTIQETLNVHPAPIIIKK